MLSVSVSPDADDPEVIVSAPLVLIDYDVRTERDTSIATRAPAEGGRIFGTPSQVLAIGHRQVLFTDLVSSNIRYLRLPTPPFVTSPYTRVIAGGEDERGTDNAGYVEGPPNVARFDEPRGLQLDGDRLIVADAGNRRVRSGPLPHFRVPESGFVHDYDDRHFEIAYVGPSVTFWDSFDDASICGVLESRITASGRVSKPVRCHSIRMDAPTVPIIEDYIDTYLAVQHHIDLIVIPISRNSVIKMDRDAPAAANAASFRASIDLLEVQVRPTGARIVLVWQPDNVEISDGEDLTQREEDSPSFPDDLTARRAEPVTTLDAALAGSGV
jgi:hypothetical protein